MKFYYVYTFEIWVFPNIRFIQKLISNIPTVEKVKSLCRKKLCDEYQRMTVSNFNYDKLIYDIKFINCQRVYTVETALDVVLI